MDRSVVVVALLLVVDNVRVLYEYSYRTAPNPYLSHTCPRMNERHIWCYGIRTPHDTCRCYISSSPCSIARVTSREFGQGVPAPRLNRIIHLADSVPDIRAHGRTLNYMHLGVCDGVECRSIYRVAMSDFVHYQLQPIRRSTPDFMRRACRRRPGPGPLVQQASVLLLRWPAADRQSA